VKVTACDRCGCVCKHEGSDVDDNVGGGQVVFPFAVAPALVYINQKTKDHTQDLCESCWESLKFWWSKID